MGDTWHGKEGEEWVILCIGRRGEEWEAWVILGM